MKNSFLAFLIAGFFTAMFSGCYTSPDGRMRPGMPFGKDTFESRYQRSADEVFQAAKEVLKFNGTLYGENTINKTLEAKIDNRTVWVAVDEVEPKVTRVRVQARKKGGLPDILWAGEIDKQIALKLPR